MKMRHAGACVLIAAAVVASFATGAFATNGMNLEGYGPIATAMGGASFAFWNGTAAVMNNPATLGLMPLGWHADFAFGILGPDVKAIALTPSGALTAKSSSTAFYMPALGIAMKKSAATVGLAVFSQGGMGTEYGRDSWLADPSQGANTALTEGLINRSEVGVGRVMVPITYDVNDRLIVGGTVDFVWAGIDLQMAMSEAQFQDLANPMAQTLGTASGSFVNTFGTLYEPFGGSGVRRLYHAYFDFSDESALTGQAKGYGVAGKVGALYRVNDRLSVGAVFHSPTALGDIETTKATLGMGVSIDPGILGGTPTGSYQDMDLAVTGTIAVKDFEWPAVLGGGVAYEPMKRLMLALDFKYIFWSNVMESFKMHFTADRTEANGAFGGLEMDAALFQKWDDQAVIAVGGALKATDELTVRGGYNYGKNPVPAKYLNALFPAIVESHATLGAGYRITSALQADFSLVFGFEKKETNPGNGLTIPAVESTHSQMNWQFMVGYQF